MMYILNLLIYFQAIQKLFIMANAEKSAVKIIFGAMTFGQAGTEQGKVNKLPECREILGT